MTGRAKTRNVRTGAALAASAIALASAGCGGDEDFDRSPRPPVAVDLTGVIQEDKVTVSPDRVGAGPISITVSNQTKDAHTLTLEGTDVRERVGPVNPEDTATLQKTLKPGTYEVRAGSAVAAPREIEPALLEVGPERKNSSDELLLP